MNGKKPVPPQSAHPTTIHCYHLNIGIKYKAVPVSQSRYA
jgi:hypothetical protein